MSKINEMIKAMDNCPEARGFGNVWCRWHYANNMGELVELCAASLHSNSWGGWEAYFHIVVGDDGRNGAKGFVYVYTVDGHGDLVSAAFIAAEESEVRDALLRI